MTAAPAPAGTARGPRARGLQAWAAVLVAMALFVAVVTTSGGVSHPLQTVGALLTPAGQSLVIAHRGDASAAPENTLPAFEAAIDGDFDDIETDLHLTADGRIVVMHDDTVDRTTNGTGAIADLTLAQIEKLDAGSWFDSSFAGEKVPTLSALLAVLASDPEQRAFLELKGNWSSSEVRKAVAAIDAAGLADTITLESFSVISLVNLRAVATEIPRFFLVRSLDQKTVRLATALGVVGVGARITLVADAPSETAELRARGIAVLTYTLDTAADWAEALAVGIDGIFTDDPEALRSWLASRRTDAGGHPGSWGDSQSTTRTSGANAT